MKFHIILSACLLLIIFTFQRTTFVNCTDNSGIDPIAETLQTISNHDNDAGLPPLISELNKKLTVCEELKQLTDEKIQEFCKSTEYSVYMKCVEYNKKKFQEQKRRMKRSTDCDLDDCDQDDICDSNVCQNSCRTCTDNCQECESCSRCTSNSCCHRHCRRQCSSTRCRHACVKNCEGKSKPSTHTVTNTQTDTRTDSHTSNTTVLSSYNLTTAIKFTNYINTSNVVDIPININTTNVNNITLTEQVSKQPEIHEPCCYITTPTECVNITVEPYRQCVHRRYKVCGPQCYQQPAPPPQPPVILRVPYGIPVPYTVVQRVPIPQPFPIERTVVQPQPYPVPRPYPIMMRQLVPYPQPYPVPVIQPQPQPIPVPQPIVQPIPVPQPIVQPISLCPFRGGCGCHQQSAGVSICNLQPYTSNLGYYGAIANSSNFGVAALPPIQPLPMMSPYTIQTLPQGLPQVSVAPLNGAVLGSDSTLTSTALNQNIFNTAAGSTYTLPAAGQAGEYAYASQLGGYVGGAQLGGYVSGYPGNIQYTTDQLGGQGYVSGIAPQTGVQYVIASGNQTVPISTLPGVLPGQSNIGQYQYYNANVYPGTGIYSAIGNPGATYNITTDTSAARPYGLHQFFNQVND